MDGNLFKCKAGIPRNRWGPDKDLHTVFSVPLAHLLRMIFVSLASLRVAAIYGRSESTPFSFYFVYTPRYIHPTRESINRLVDIVTESRRLVWPIERH